MNVKHIKNGHESIYDISIETVKSSSLPTRYRAHIYHKGKLEATTYLVFSKEEAIQDAKKWISYC